MRILVAFLFLFASCFSWSQTAFEKGMVLDSIPVPNTKETFAIYLPTQYNPNEPSPIVFIFEPAARGRIGIEPFVLASEKYGYVLVCSNNSRNGPYNRNIPIAERLFDYLFSIVNIDSKQIFLSGFSGGSRLASTIAASSDSIAGVIACGAGLSSNPALVPYEGTFLYAGICGNRDMNYSEMLGLQPFLKSIGLTHALFIYDGSHTWPPPDEMEKVFDWIAVQLHKRNIEPLKREELQGYYEEEYATVLQDTKEKNYLRTTEGLERILLSYSTMFNLDSISLQLKEHQKSKDYKLAVKSNEKTIAQEKLLSQKYIDRIFSDFKDLDQTDLSWWRKEFEKLKKKSISGDVYTQKMVERLRYRVFAFLYENTSPNLNANTTDAQLAYSKQIIELLKTFSPNR
ncbi:hypothetical protein [Maribacter sp. 2210JD10-5]|uniref:hypothetical protein n=1 Tax=Maribacter sp. 2210JD10-5 TaxID=3386272 RepID=UPI0039BC2CE6